MFKLKEELHLTILVDDKLLAQSGFDDMEELTIEGIEELYLSQELPLSKEQYNKILESNYESMYICLDSQY